MAPIIKVWRVGKRGNHAINERTKGKCESRFRENNSTYNFTADISGKLWVEKRDRKPRVQRLWEPLSTESRLNQWQQHASAAESPWRLVPFVLNAQHSPWFMSFPGDSNSDHYMFLKSWTSKDMKEQSYIPNANTWHWHCSDIINAGHRSNYESKGVFLPHRVVYKWTASECLSKS